MRFPFLTTVVLLIALSFTAFADTITPVSWNNQQWTALLNGAPITMVCIDYARPSPQTSQPYEANISSIASPVTAHHTADTLKYTQAAWLYTQLTDPLNASQSFAIQTAMWSLFTPGIGSPASSPWLARSLSAAPGFNTTGFIVITPNSTNSQTMIAHVSAAPVPEPGCLFLLGSGLALLSRKRIFNRLFGSQLPASEV